MGYSASKSSFPSSWLSLCSSSLHSSPLSSSSLLFFYSYLNFSSFSLKDIIFHFFSLGSPEFQFLVVPSYFRSFLYLLICYPFRLYIWVLPVYLSLWESYILTSHFPSYNYVLCLPPQNAGFHGTPVCVFLSIPRLVADICTSFLRIWFSFQRGRPFFFYFLRCILSKGEYAIVYFPIIIHLFYFVSWCVFVFHPKQIHTGIISSVPTSVLSFLKHSSIIFFF